MFIVIEDLKNCCFFFHISAIFFYYEKVISPNLYSSSICCAYDRFTKTTSFHDTFVRIFYFLKYFLNN